jgi:hypothetical protein
LRAAVVVPRGKALLAVRVVVLTALREVMDHLRVVAGVRNLLGELLSRRLVQHCKVVLLVQKATQVVRVVAVVVIGAAVQGQTRTPALLAAVALAILTLRLLHPLY